MGINDLLLSLVAGESFEEFENAVEQTEDAEFLETIEA